MKIKFKSVIKILLPIVLAASIGTFFVITDNVNYGSLEKPFLTPPSFVFGIAWTIIYILCFISAYIFDNKSEDKELNQKGTVLLYINMFINLLWTISFFGLGLLTVSLIILALLYFSTVSLFLTYKKVNKLSSVLLIPYLLWLLLAFYLNICIVFLN